ncbi:MAG: DUF1491 family protein [Sphingomonadaceae bacterium]|nr:DUF1491 family protein [Sphingomonadaceae bacterium]
MDGRLPAHIEVGGLIRAAEAEGGFGTVLARGERDAGTILILTMQRGANAQLWERMPQLDGTRQWTVIKVQDHENKHEMSEYLDRRKQQDSDIWIVELDIADAQRFAALQQNLG